MPRELRLAKEKNLLPMNATVNPKYLEGIEACQRCLVDCRRCAESCRQCAEAYRKMAA